MYLAGFRSREQTGKEPQIIPAPNPLVYLTKSDFKVARTCPAKLFYKKNRYPSLFDENPYLGFLADGGYMVEKMAKLLFEGGIEMESWREPEKAFAETVKIIETHDTVVMFEPTVIHGRYSARIDILAKEGNVLKLIEVKSSSIDSGASGQGNPFRGQRGGIESKWKPYLEDVAFQYLVLSEAFPNHEVRPYLCLVDKAKRATRDTTCDQFRLTRDHRPDAKSWAPEVEFLGDLESMRRHHLLAMVDVSGEVAEIFDEVKEAAAVFAGSFGNGRITRIPVELSQKCKACEYRLPAGKHEKNGFRECWGELAGNAPHVLDLYRIDLAGGKNHNLIAELAAQGKSSLTDIPEEALQGEAAVRQRLQLECLSSGEWIAPELPGVLSKHPRPLHFIDFEASRLALPYHTGMRPYELAAFQWSCHTLHDADGPTAHHEWLNDDNAFPNFAFIRSLRDRIGDNGTVYTWSPYEISTLKEIRGQMDQYGENDRDLMDWIDWMTEKGNPRIVDLLRIAKENYIHPAMKGSLSIKDVLPAAWASNPRLRAREEFRKYVGHDSGEILLNPYETLPPLPIGDREEVVKEGTGAMRVYQEMMFGLSAADPVVRRQYRSLLLQYCELDTAAMVMIWRHWAGTA